MSQLTVIFCDRNNNRSAGSHQLRRYKTPVSADDWRQSGTIFCSQGLHATVPRS